MNDPSTQTELDERLHEAIAEYLVSVDSNTPLDQQAWLNRHGDLASALRAFLEAQEQMRRMARPLLESSAELARQASVMHHANTAEWKGPAAPEGQPVGDRFFDCLPCTFGRYQILARLGKGGMGSVYLALDTTLGRKVALKLAHLDSADGQAAERFLREAQTAARLQHEGICRVLDYGEVEGKHYLTMEYVQGRPLSDLLKDARTNDPRWIATVISQVARSLDVAHRQGVVHRDIKPGNIMLDTSDRPTLVDFGLARWEQEVTVSREGVVGTLAYMSPEQLNAESATPRSDIYSLGVTLYYLLTGALPFPGLTLSQLVYQVARRSADPPRQHRPDLDPMLEEIILKALARWPEDRFATAKEMADSLDAWMAGAVGTGDGAKPPRDVWKETPVWGSPRVRLLVVAVVLLVSLGGIGWLVHLALRSDPAPSDQTVSRGDSQPTGKGASHTPVRYRGKIDVLVERTIAGKPSQLRLNEPGALPLRKTDRFRIEGEVDPPAYLYLVWVDPNHDVTPVYPWDPTKSWDSRPEVEKPVGKISLPVNKGNHYTAPDAKSGVATMVLFARATPLDVPDDEVRKWFEQLPDLPLPAGGDGAAVWFDDYMEVRERSRLRTFGVVGSNDPFAQWQGQLQKVLGDQAAFQTAVSFARTGGK